MMKSHLEKNFRPKIIVCESEELVDIEAVRTIQQLVLKNLQAVLALPTGNTPIGMYKHLVQLVKNGKLDLSHTTIFNIDEYYPIDPLHPDSFASYMKQHLLDHVSVGAWYIPRSDSENFQEEAVRYQEILNKYQPIDLVVLGIGPGLTCHIGFNEQGSTIDSTVRYIKLSPETIQANTKHLKDPQTIRDGGITMGIADILLAKEIVVIAKSKNKAEGIQRSLEGAVSSDAPASFLQLHPHVTYILDKDAASLLSTDYQKGIIYKTL